MKITQCHVWFTVALLGTFCMPSLIQAKSPNTPESLFDLSLEELMDIQVTTVSRVEEYRDNAPGSIYVFPRSVIKQRGYRSLGELLQTVPGFTVFHRDLQFVAGVRGLNANDNEKITLLINGQELNGVQEPDFLNGPINLDNVERVEVVVGPSSFFQPANTLAATVNVITRRIDGTELVLSTGSDLPYSATLMTGKQFGEDRFWNFSLTTEQKQGFDAWASDFRPNLAGHKDTGRLEGESFFGIFNGQSGDWSIQAVAHRSVFPELLITNGSPLNDGVYTDEIYSVYLKNQHVIDSDLTSIFSIAAAYKKASRENENGLPQPDTAAEQSISQWDYNAELGLLYKGFENHFIQTGAQLGYEDNRDSWFTWNAMTGLPSFPQKTSMLNEDSTSVGFYISDDYKISDDLELVNGIRADLNTLLDYRWQIGGRSAIIYHATDTWTTKLIYNRSVRYPSQLAANNTVWGRGKDGPPWTRHFPNATEPEILSTVEWQNIIYFDRIRFGVTPYYQDLSDFISWSEPHSNVGNFSGFGIETDIQWQATSNMTVWGNTAFNDSELHAFYMAPPPDSSAEQHHALVDDDNRIVGSAKFTANVGVDWELAKNLTFSCVMRYFTGQTAHDYSAGEYIQVNNRYYLDAAFLWKNAFGKDMDLRVSGTNILDNRDPVGGQWLGDTYRPRGAAVTVSAYIRF